MTSDGPYGPVVARHLAEPRGAGPLEGADRVGRATNDACGDQLTLYLRTAGGRIEAAGFQAAGCAPALAVGSLLVELLTGSSLDDARALTAEDVGGALGELPRAKRHVLALARQALQDALGE